MNATAQTTAHLEQLKSELVDRGWTAKIRQAPDHSVRLHVKNPRISRMSDDITCDGGVYSWAWGQEIGPVEEIPRVADQVMFVLREVSS